MDNNIKETKLEIGIRKYNGAYGIGSVFDHDYIFTARPLEYEGYALIKYKEYIRFCANEENYTNEDAKINFEVPYLVTTEELNKFYEIVNEIKNNPDYKYNESHYSKEGFDHKYYNYMDIIIDDECFETDDETIFEKLNGIIDFKKYTELTGDYCDKLSEYMEETNGSFHSDRNFKFKENI